jgi:mono/diheme cytochrome c family protein
MSRYALLLVGLLTGCSSESKMPAPVDRQVDFAADVQPIFAKHCIGCHGPEKQKGSYRLDVKEKALNGDAVKVGDSAGSPLIQHVLGLNDRKRMPPEGPNLSDEQVGILRAWIDQGAAWIEIPPRKE